MKTQINETTEKIFLDQRALIVNDKQEVLLVRTEEFGWDLPGGLFSRSSTWREDLETQVKAQLDLDVMTENTFYTADYQNAATGEFTIMNVVSCKVFGSGEGFDYDEKEYAKVGWYSAFLAAEMEFSTFDIKDSIKTYFELDL